MKIYGPNWQPIQADRTEKAMKRPAKPVAPLKSADIIEISKEGRALAAKEQVAAERTTRLDPERIAKIREEIRSGAYDDPDVIAAVARRMLELGDV